jgi:phospho-N-acetylmuramoyl-pentapeptide-transferase
MSVRSSIAGITALAMSIIVGPWLIRKLYELKIGDKVDRAHCAPLSALHRDKHGTPTMGGLLVLAAVLIPSVLWMNLKNVYTLIVLFSTLWLGVLGAVDDYLKLKHEDSRGLSTRKKLFWQTLLGLMVGIVIYALPEGGGVERTPVSKLSGGMIVAALAAQDTTAEAVDEGAEVPAEKKKLSYPKTLYIPFYKHPVANIGFLYIFFCALVIVGSSNAVNLTDGLDGLAIGCSVIVAAVYLVISYLTSNVILADYLNLHYIRGSEELVIFLSCVIGAGLGFLWYNAYPAQVFMGDTGSLALGGAIGVCSIVVKKEFLLIIAGGIFVLEALSVILQVFYFKKTRKRMFLMAPIHHHFEMQGMLETKVTIRFWIITIIFAVLSLASLKLQ